MSIEICIGKFFETIKSLHGIERLGMSKNKCYSIPVKVAAVTYSIIYIPCTTPIDLHIQYIDNGVVHQQDGAPSAKTLIVKGEVQKLEAKDISLKTMDKAAFYFKQIDKLNLSKYGIDFKDLECVVGHSNQRLIDSFDLMIGNLSDNENYLLKLNVRDLIRHVDFINDNGTLIINDGKYVEHRVRYSMFDGESHIYSNSINIFATLIKIRESEFKNKENIILRQKQSIISKITNKMANKTTEELEALFKLI